MGHAMAVVPHFDRFDPFQSVPMERHVDARGVGVKRVPHQFG